MSKITFDCDCGKHYAAPVTMAGKRIKCGQCGYVVDVPTFVPVSPATSPIPSVTSLPTPQSHSRPPRRTTVGIAFGLLIAFIAIIGLLGIRGSLPGLTPLTPLQKLARHEILHRYIDPQDIHFDRWYPEVEESTGSSWPNATIFTANIHDAKTWYPIPCDHVVRVHYRFTSPLGFDVKRDGLFFFDKGKLAGSYDRDDVNGFIPNENFVQQPIDTVEKAFQAATPAHFFSQFRRLTYVDIADHYYPPVGD